MSKDRPRPGERYRHFKGNLYQIVTIAKHSETGEELVIYQALYGSYEVYARPLAMFLEESERMITEPATEMTGQIATKPEPAAANEEEEQAAPELMRFLDADTYHDKYKVLQGMENTITDRLINDFAVILDVVIPEGKLSDRFEQLKQCVATMAR